MTPPQDWPLEPTTSPLLACCSGRSGLPRGRPDATQQGWHRNPQPGPISQGSAAPAGAWLPKDPSLVSSCKGGGKACSAPPQIPVPSRLGLLSRLGLPHPAAPPSLHEALLVRTVGTITPLRGSSPPGAVFSPPASRLATAPEPGTGHGLSSEAPPAHPGDVLTLGKVRPRSSLLCLALTKEEIWDQHSHELGRVSPTRARGAGWLCPQQQSS